MKTTSTLFLVASVVVLGVVYFTTRPDYQKTAERVQTNIFDEQLADKVAKITIEKGKESVEIAVHDNRWSLPQRDNFPADPGKVNSFLLKFFSLSATQLVTTNTEKYEKFGLTEKAVQDGKSRVTFMDASGGVLSQVYLGENRKGKTPAMSPNMPFAAQNFAGTGGQYIRTEGTAGVYLVDQNLPVQTGLKNWFDQTVINVVSASTERVRHYGLNGASESPLYTLNREWQDDPEQEGKRTSKWLLEKAGGGKADDAAVSLVSTGLQNLRMDDVHKEGTDAAEGLNFDMRTRYYLSNGLRYDIDSAQKDSKTFVKVSVAFDEAYAEELKAAKEEEKTAAEAKAAAAKKAAEEAKAADEMAEAEGEEASAEGDEQAQDEPAAAKPAEEPKVAPLVLSNAEEAAKLGFKFEGWIYELPEYLGKKFRQNDKMIVGEGKKEKAEEAAPQPVDQAA